MHKTAYHAEGDTRCLISNCTCTEYKDIPPVDTMNADQWNYYVMSERIRQIEDLGYDADHDLKGGMRHLMGHAVQSIRSMQQVKAAALVLAMNDLSHNQRREDKRKWLWRGILYGVVFDALIVIGAVVWTAVL